MTDEALRAYYALLDSGQLGAPRDIQVRRCEETETIGGRYEISWLPPLTGSATGYEVTILVGAGEDRETYQPMGSPRTVYETRVTFYANEDLNGQNFFVQVRAFNGVTSGPAEVRSFDELAQRLPGGETPLPVANRLEKPVIHSMTLNVGGSAVTDTTTATTEQFYNGMILAVTVNGSETDVDYKMQVWYYDTAEEADAAVTNGPSGPGRLQDDVGLTRTLAATWEDAGKYMVVGVQAFNQSDVSSFWTYQVYSIPLPAMQLPSCAPEINIVTQSVPITVGDGSDTLPAMKLRACL